MQAICTPIVVGPVSDLARAGSPRPARSSPSGCLRDGADARIGGGTIHKPYRGPNVDGLLFGGPGGAVWWLSRKSGKPVALRILDGPDHGALVRIRLEAVAADQLPGYFLAPYGPTTLEQLAITLHLLPYSHVVP